MKQGFQCVFVLSLQVQGKKVGVSLSLDKDQLFFGNLRKGVSQPDASSHTWWLSLQICFFALLSCQVLINLIFFFLNFWADYLLFHFVNSSFSACVLEWSTEEFDKLVHQVQIAFIYIYLCLCVCVCLYTYTILAISYLITEFWGCVHF